MADHGDVERRFIHEMLSSLASLFLVDPRPSDEWSRFMGEILERLCPVGLSVEVTTELIKFQISVKDRRNPTREGTVHLNVPCPLPPPLREPNAPAEMISVLIVQLDEDVMGGTRQHLSWH